MSDMHKADRKIRFLMKATESPTYSNLQLQVNKAAHPVGVSPMSTLALDLSGATLESSPSPSALPIRRLTLGDVTPTRSDAVAVPTVVLDQMARPGGDKKRLLKNTSVRFGGSPKESPSGRPRGVLRRIDLTPVTGNDENAHPAFAAPRDCEMPPLVAAAPPPASSPSKFAMMMRNQQQSPFRHRQPLEDYDPNSQDSGFGADKCDAKTGFRFAEPFGLAPRRQLTDQSPRKENSSSPRSKSTHHIQASKLFSSQSLGSSSESIDDGFIEFFDYDKCGEDANLPTAINCLFDKPLYIEDIQSAAVLEEKVRPSFRRSLSLMETNTPNSSRARSCLFSSSPMQTGEVGAGSPTDASRPFKRPESPCDHTSGPAKRRKSTPFHDVCDNVLVGGGENLFPKSCVRKSPALKQSRCFAETEATIMTALHRASQEPDLIGDFSMPYLLPLMDGRHPDLKTISHDTLAHLVEGRFSDEIDSFTIVDCRYPYEFDGGHIRGATNVYTRDQVLRDFVGAARQADGPCAEATAKRKRIVVFHCEFSSERGPNLYRYLRNVDRDQNKECYPSLHYPELYLLNGGYKLFYEHHGVLCEPQSYRPMLHPSHESELKLFRAKSKSWSGDSKSRLAMRSSLKRLGL